MHTHTHTHTHAHAYVGTHTHAPITYTHICWNIHTHLHAYPHLVACHLTPQTNLQNHGSSAQTAAQTAQTAAHGKAKPILQHLGNEIPRVSEKMQTLGARFFASLGTLDSLQKLLELRFTFCSQASTVATALCAL